MARQKTRLIGRTFAEPTQKKPFLMRESKWALQQEAERETGIRYPRFTTKRRMVEDMKLAQVTRTKATAETRESDIWRRKITDMGKKDYINKHEAMEDLVKVRKALNKSASQKPTNIESGKDKQRYEKELKSTEEHISSELKQKFGIKKVEVIPFGFTEAEEKILYE